MDGQEVEQHQCSVIDVARAPVCRAADDSPDIEAEGSTSFAGNEQACM